MPIDVQHGKLFNKYRHKITIEITLDYDQLYPTDVQEKYRMFNEAEHMNIIKSGFEISAVHAIGRAFGTGKQMKTREEEVYKKCD